MDKTSSHFIDSLLVHAVSERLAGGTPDVDRIAEEHPELAEVIRSRWQFLERIRDQLGSDAGSTLRPGQTIGEFTIVEELGRGGMGVVYKAQQQHPHRQVALKVLISPIAGPESSWDVLEHEAQSLARLEHVGIARIYQASGRSARTSFLAMEFVDGVPLDEHADSKNLSAHARLELFLRVCDAIEYAHQQGIIHQDLKPANVMVTHDGQPKVLDFGLAKLVGPDIHSATLTLDSDRLQGTLAFMSPEQAGSGPPNIRGDVYSLGVILFQLLTDQLPYDLANRSIFESIKVIESQEPAHPRTINTSISVDVATIILKALAKQPAKRYHTVAELSDDVQRYLDHRPIKARRIGIVGRTTRLMKRRPAATLTMLCLLAVAVLTTVLAHQQTLRSIARRESRILQLRDDASYYIHAATAMPRPMWLPDEIQLRYERARACLDEIIALDGDSPWPYIQRGRVGILLDKNLVEASADFRVALLLDPTLASPKAFIKLASHKMDKRGIHPSDWETGWQPTGQEDLYFCAVAAELYGYSDKGYEWFSALLENHPNDYWGLLGLEGSFGFHALPHDHVAHLVAAKRLRPDLLSSYLGLAAWYRVGDKFEEEIRTLQQALELAPTEVLIYRELAAAHQASGDPKEAEAWHKKTIALSPTSVPLGKYAQFLERQGRVDESLRYLDKAIDEASQHHDVTWHIHKSLVLKREGQDEQARQILRDALLIDSTDTWALRTLANLEDDAGHHTEAIDLLRQAVDLSTMNPPSSYLDYYANLAEVILKRGRVTAYEDTLLEGLQVAESKSHELLKSSNLPALNTSDLRQRLASLYWAQGLRDQALDLYHADIRAHPSTARAYIDFAQFWERTEHLDRAIEQYHKAIGLSYEHFERDQHCRTQIGHCLAGLGRLSDAIEQYFIAYIIASSHDKENALLELVGTLLDHSWPQSEEEQYRLHINMRGTFDLTTQDLRFQEALKLANQAIEDYGESIEALRLRGKARAKLGQLDKALQDYAAGFEMSCTLPLPYSFPAGDELARQKTLDEYVQFLGSTTSPDNTVDDVCQRAIAQYPSEQTKSAAHQIYATHLLSAGRLELAEEHGRKACDAAPGYPLNCGTYGLVLDAVNKFDAASEAYLAAIQADPLNYAMYLSLCSSLSRTEEGPQRGIEFVMIRMGQLYQTPVEHWSNADCRAASCLLMMNTVFHAKKGSIETSLKQLKLWKQSITIGAVPEGDVRRQLLALQVILRKASECEVLVVAADYAAELLGECPPRTLQALRSVSTVLQAAGLPSRSEDVLRQYLDRCRSVCAQNTEACLGGQHQLFVLMREQGRLEEAEELARTTIQDYSETLGPTHTLTLSAYTNLGRALSALGRHAEAEPIFRTCVADRERIFGPDHFGTLSSHIELAECLTGQGRMDEAADIYSKLVPRADSILGPTHVTTLMAKFGYAGLHFKLKQLDHTEALLLSMLPDVKLVFGDEHPQAIHVLSMLGASLMLQEKYTQAEPFLKDALSSAFNTLGVTHTITQQRIQSLVGLYDFTGNKEDAEELLRRALDALHGTEGYSHLLAGSTAYSLARRYKDRHAYGDADPLYREVHGVSHELWSEREDRANFVREYGEVLFNVGKYDEMEKILREWRDFLRKSAGSDHADTLEILRGISGFFIQQGKFAEAEQFAREALEIEERVHGEDTNEALILGNNLGLALMGQHRFDEADETLEHCLELRREQYGEAHRETIVATQNLALLRMLQQRQDEAERMMRDCLAISRQVLGEKSPVTILTLTVIGGWLQDEHEYAEAESMLREAVALARAAGHESGLILSQCLGGLAYLLCERGQLLESEALVQEIMVIHENVLPDDHYRKSGPLLIQGMVLMQRDEHAKAEEYLKTAVRICNEKLPAWSFAVGYSQSVLGECLYSLERFEEAEPFLKDGFEIIRDAQGMQHRRTQEAVERLVRLYEDWAKPGQAETYRALLRHPPFATEKPTRHGSQP